LEFDFSLGKGYQIHQSPHDFRSRSRVPNHGRVPSHGTIAIQNGIIVEPEY